MQRAVLSGRVPGNGLCRGPGRRGFASVRQPGAQPLRAVGRGLAWPTAKGWSPAPHTRHGREGAAPQSLGDLVKIQVKAPRGREGRSGWRPQGTGTCRAFEAAPCRPPSDSLMGVPWALRPPCSPLSLFPAPHPCPHLGLKLMSLPPWCPHWAKVSSGSHPRVSSPRPPSTAVLCSLNNHRSEPPSLSTHGARPCTKHFTALWGTYKTPSPLHRWEE